MSKDTCENNTKLLHAEKIRTCLLHVLQDCEFHSGEDLAQQFCLSRSSISNHVKALCKLGIDIYSVKRRGYKLSAPIDLLSFDKICDALPEKKIAQYSLIQVENLVGSTNDVLKQILRSSVSTNSGQCCLAEAQSAGRGRRGKSWVSPYGSSLYFSMLWHFHNGYQAMSGLSLMIGVVLNRTLKSLNYNQCQLKWPNDIYYKNQKLAGILIEVEGQVGGHASAIIGVGVNIKLPPKVQGIDQAFTDLYSISQANSAYSDSKHVMSIDRNQLAAQLINHLWEALPEFELHGLAPFMQEWQQADLYFNQEVNLLSGEQVTRGVSRGIDSSGALLLEVKRLKDATSSEGSSKQNHIQAFHGGEISVRPV